jgi:hypothetical protein
MAYKKGLSRVLVVLLVIVFLFSVFAIFYGKDVLTNLGSVISEETLGGTDGGESTPIRYECTQDSDCDEEGEICWNHVCAKVFDIKIIDFESPIKLGEFFEFTYLVKGMAKIDGDVEVQFWIEKQGETISSGLDTIYIGNFEEKIETTKIFLPQNVDSGVYQFFIQIGYGSYTARSSRTIEIEVKEGIAGIISIQEDSKLSPYVVLGILLLIALIIFGIILLRYIKKRKKIIFKVSKIKPARPKSPRIKLPKFKLSLPKLKLRLPEKKPPKLELPKAKLLRIKPAKPEPPKIKLPRWRLKLPKLKLKLPKAKPSRIKPKKIKTPKFKKPKFKLPKLKLPKLRLRLPEKKPPKIKFPKARPSRVKPRKIKFPKFKKPKFKLPKLKLRLPEKEIKKVYAPKIRAPKIKSPKIKAPKLKFPKLKLKLPKLKLKLPEKKPSKIEFPKAKPFKIKPAKPEAPKIKLPKFKLKFPKIKTKLKLPESKPKKIGFPEMDVPKIKPEKPEAPKIRILKIKEPGLRLPQPEKRDIGIRPAGFFRRFFKKFRRKKKRGELIGKLEDRSQKFDQNYQDFKKKNPDYKKDFGV